MILCILLYGEKKIIIDFASYQMWWYICICFVDFKQNWLSLSPNWNWI